MGSSRSCRLLFLVLALVVLHVTAREAPKSKDGTPQEVAPKETTSTLVNNPNTNGVQSQDQSSPNNDDKHFLPFGGVGAAGGIGGVAGFVPIDFLDRSGLGTGFLPGGGLGGIGGGGAPGGGSGSCSCSGGVGGGVPSP